MESRNFAELKEEIDKLENYGEKIEFWFENNLGEYNQSYLINEDDDENKLELPSAKGDDEKLIFVEKWTEYYKRTKPELFSQNLINDINKRLENAPRKKELIETEISSIARKLDNRRGQRKERSYGNRGFWEGFNSAQQVYDIDYSKWYYHLPRLLSGKATCEYLGYLEATLEKLNKGEAINPSISTEPMLGSVIPKQENQKVMLLYELGIFDYLQEKHKLDNETKLAQIIESFSGIKQDTIRQTYRAIIGTSTREANNPYNSVKNNTFLNNAFSEFGIARKKKVE